MTDTLFMPKSIVQCSSIYSLNEEGIGRIENQMNRYGEGNTRNPRKGGGYDIKGTQRVDGPVFVGFRPNYWMTNYSDIWAGN